MPEPIKRVIPSDPLYRAETFKRIFLRCKPVTKVEALGPCWEWTGTVNKAGYAISSVKVVGEGRKIMGAHRIIKALDDDLEAIPSYECHHRCMNSSCCNPAHLNWMPPGNHRVWEAAQEKINAGKSVSLRFVARSTYMSEGAAQTILLAIGAKPSLLH